ncbi:MAG TPA: hypothetical protein VI299_00615 [Polyangiales bacterium]
MTAFKLRRLSLVPLLLGLASAAHAQPAAEPSAADAGLVEPPSAAPTPGVESTPPSPASDALSYEPTGDAPAIEALSDSELGALGLDLAGPRVDTTFHLSGFADFSVFVPIKPRGFPSFVLGKHTSFYVGNINLYLSKNLSESFRTMAEVRFSYLPNGGYVLRQEEFPLTNASSFDYVNRSVAHWGGIIMQRVYLEWTLHRLLAVRGGQFLTPYGIWNVDHGSPTYIPVQRPYTILSNLFPERQTGFEFFGRWDASNQSTIGYHLTLSNGTGPISEYRDLDDNKAFGWRLYWEYHGTPTYLRIGTSGYYGRDTATINNIIPTANSGARATQTYVTQSDNLALAADLLLKVGGVHFQVEWVGRQRRYTPEGRTVHGLFGAAATRGVSADVFDWGTYGIFAYHFPWYNLSPYLTIEYTDTVIDFFLADASFAVLVAHAGISVNPTDTVTFKLEAGQARYPGGSPFLTDEINAIQFQAAWAF